MRCAACSTENPDSARFCSNCAEPLELACANCGTPWEHATARYCAECGAELAGAPRTSTLPGTAGLAGILQHPLAPKFGAGLLVVIVAFGLLRSDGKPPNPLDAGSCDELAAIEVRHLQQLLDDYGDARDREDPRVEQADRALRATFELIDVRAEALACDRDAEYAMVCSRHGDLRAHGPYAREVLFDIQRNLC